MQTQAVVIVPAYNPAQNLVTQVRELLASGGYRTVVVVDDGSNKLESKKVFQEVANIPNVTLLTHAVNLGKGAALKLAFNHVLVHEPEARGVITMDADGQHLIDDVKKVEAKMIALPRALILGGRSFKGEIPLRSRFGNEMTKWIFRILVGRPLSDTQTGLRGIPRTLLPHLLSLKSSRYDFELDMLIRAVELQVPFEEVSIQTVYLDGNSSSHFSPLLDSARIYFVFFRFIFSSVLTAIVDTATFSVFFLMSSSLFPSIVAGRVVAGTFNFKLNKSFVFHSGEGGTLRVLKYFALVFVLMWVSFGGVRLLNHRFAWSVYLAKPAVEGMLFLFSFAMQRTFIFAQREEAACLNS